MRERYTVHVECTSCRRTLYQGAGLTHTEVLGLLTGTPLRCHPERPCAENEHLLLPENRWEIRLDRDPEKEENDALEGCAQAGD